MEKENLLEALKDLARAQVHGKNIRAKVRKAQRSPGLQHLAATEREKRIWGGFDPGTGGMGGPVYGGGA